jgi:dimethylamine monooxygenase subunit A
MNQDALQTDPVYRPYRWAAADFQLGLRPMKPDEWIIVGPDHVEVMRQKQLRLTQHRRHYYRSLPSSLPAQRELRDSVVDHLVTAHSPHFIRTGRTVKSVVTGADIDLNDETCEPLLQLGELIEEDFMLLEDVEGALQITAASNAYSSSGRLVSSVGRDMAFAHAPVPGLTDKLGPKIDRVLGAVHAATPCERFNWLLTPMASIFFPHEDPHAANAAAMHSICEALRHNPGRAGELLWIRVERQTLRRLPVSKAVAFSLHTFSHPLASIQSDIESVRAMLGLLRQYSAERWHYVEMDIVREPLMQWLESAANAAV